MIPITKRIRQMKVLLNNMNDNSNKISINNINSTNNNKKYPQST